MSLRIAVTFWLIVFSLQETSIDDGCMLWNTKENKLTISCRTRDFSKPLSLFDNRRTEYAKCSFEHFRNQSIRCSGLYESKIVSVDVQKKEVRFAIHKFKSKDIDGIWTCVQGNKRFKSNVSKSKGIVDNTDIYLEAEFYKINNTKRVSLQCSASKKSRGNNVEFLINNRSELSITYEPVKRKCIYRNGDCHPDICSCLSTGKEFNAIFPIDSDNNKTYSCNMHFKDEETSMIFSRTATILFNGNDFEVMRTSTHIIKQPNGENKDTQREVSSTTTIKHDTDLGTEKMNTTPPTVLGDSPNKDKEHGVMVLIGIVLICVLVSVLATLTIVRICHQRNRRKESRKVQSKGGETKSLLKDPDQNPCVSYTVTKNDIEKYDGTLTVLPYPTGKTTEHGCVSVSSNQTGTSMEHGTVTVLSNQTGTSTEHGTVTVLSNQTGTSTEHGTITVLSNQAGTSTEKGTVTAVLSNPAGTSKGKVKKIKKMEDLSKNCATKYCYPCSVQHKQQTAFIWCLDCAGGLCSYCKDTHQVMSNHTLVAIEELPINYSLSFCCTKHKHQSLDYLCIDHDELCCLECRPAYHSNCQKTEHIDVIAITYRQSKAFLDYEIQLYVCETKYKKIINEVTHCIKNIHNDCNQIEKDLREKDNIETKYARRFNSDLNSVKNMCLVTLNHYISEAEQLEASRVELKRLFDFFEKTGSNKLFTLYIHSSKQHLSEIQSKIQSLFEKMINPSVQYNEYEEGNTATGRILFFYGKDVTLPSLKKQHSETSMDKPIGQAIISFIGELKIETENIQGGMAESHNGVLLLCDTNNSRVRVLAESKQDIYIDLEYEPENISVIPDNDTAVLTSNAYDIIQFVDINRRKVIGTKEVEGSATCSLACTAEYILIGGKMKISILDHKGTHIRNIETDCELRSLSYFDEKMYFTEKGSNKVQCFEMNGESVFCHQSQTVAAPISAIPDKDGHVYILDRGHIIEKRKIPKGYFNSMHKRGPITIHKLTTSGQNIRLEISENGDLQNPISMCLNKDGTKLYILHKNGSSICMFKID